MSTGLRLKILGPFEARDADGEAVAVVGKKLQALLAYLAVEGPGAVTRETLASLLWAETGELRARHNLRQALSKLRQICGDVVLSEGDTLRLDGDRCSVDARDFVRLVAGDDEEEIAAGLGLYRRQLLEGATVREEAFEEWLRAARTRFRELACDGYQRLAGRLAGQGRDEEAIGHLRSQLAIDPACEQAHCSLMELLARTGRRSEALRQYRQCEESLERELGAAPGAATREVYEAIRDAETPLRAAIPETPAPAPIPETPPPDEVLPGAEAPSVAVLPLEHHSADEDRYFTDGITEDIITALSRFGSLLVLARASSFAYRDRELGDRQIGEELGAHFLVRGSVRKAGRHLRLAVQLIDARSGLHLWAQRFDREIEDVFLVQDEVTEEIVSTLAGRVEAARIERARRLPPERLAAYDCVQRGKDLHHRTTPEACSRAIEMFEQAIEQDPGYAVAHAWLACAYGQAMSLGFENRDRLLEQAEEEVERARDLDENESECHRILAQIYLLRQDLRRARAHQERALFLNPNDDRSVCAMGTILTLSGEPAEGEELIRRSMRLNPYHPENYWFHLGRALFHQGRAGEALAALREVTRPKLRERAYRSACAVREDPAGARKEISRLLSEHPGFDPESYAATIPYRRSEDREALLAALRTALGSAPGPGGGRGEPGSTS